MFTGIIEELGEVVSLKQEKKNIHFTLSCDFKDELKVDQSLAHNGVCLTVIAISDIGYTVTAIKETLDKSNLNTLTVGTFVNLERAMLANGRFDGHVVQGHVDQTAICKSIIEENGSWTYTFNYTTLDNITVEKGSITVNGVSLTVVNSRATEFSVCIIPFTKEHTTFNTLKINDTVNLEFDIIGKYVAKMLNKSN